MTTPPPLTGDRSREELPRDPESIAARGDALDAAFFEGPCATVAESLVGALLVHETPDGPIGGVITETEAYLGLEDPACHLAGGVTDRTRPFLDGAGTIYVYSIFGHDCLDVITEHDAYPECVLVRSLHPAVDVERMAERRGRSELRELTTGPGKLTEALGITTTEHDHAPLADSPISIYDLGLQDLETARGPRIGISEAEDWPLRFCLAGSEFLSRPLADSRGHSFDVDAFYRDLDCSRRPDAPGDD